MFKRSAVTRSLHAPHGVNIKALDNNPRMKRKLSWASPKVRNAASEGVLTHKPVLLKEGFLYKPGFFRIGGRKRRWCVLRTYSQNEASLDIYMDETKSRFKGTISLDKDLCPMLIVKNYDTKKKSPKNVYLSLKIGKRTYQFTTDSFRELKEWSSLLRQAIDNGLLFSGRITEPLNIEDGMLNVKFNSNCIAVICPIRETAIKTWRLNHITSFGQCGGILTFECCSTCSDPGTSRCSINIVQEKSSTVLNLMEKAIRSNPNTTEIHYERSILGDIYHCDHECGQPQRLLPAYSDPNIYRSAAASPHKEVSNVPIDIHEFEVPHSTVSSGHRLSSDSGFPDTPLPQHDVVSINSNTPSPTEAKSSPSASKANSASKNTTTSHGIKRGSRISTVPPPAVIHARSFSETAHALENDSAFEERLRTETDPTTGTKFTGGKLNYTDIKTTHSSPIRRKKIDSDGIQYSTVVHDSPRTSQKLEPVNEIEGIYDTPFEPTYWEVTDNGAYSPPPGVYNSQRSSRSDSSTGIPYVVRVTSAHSTSNLYVAGSDTKDRDDDLGNLSCHFPGVPNNRNKRSSRPQVKEVVKIFNGGPQQQRRSRLHSTGDVLDCTPDYKRSPRRNMRGSVDNLSQAGRVHGSNDMLSKLREQDELLTKFLARSRNERNDEFADTREDLNRPYKYESDCMSPTNTRSGRSSVTSERGVDRVLTKVASDTVRGYAYKIQIPLSDTIYDVPRRSAPAPNLTNMRSDAPPKPQRYIASTGP